MRMEQFFKKSRYDNKYLQDIKSYRALQRREHLQCTKKEI